MSSARLFINGDYYAGWKAVQVQRSIEQGAGAFTLSVSERFPGRSQNWPIKQGDACELFLDDHSAIVGFVDSVERSFDATSRRVSISGRDRTADLVDCSAANKGDATGTLNGQSLMQIAQLMCEPFGIPVRASAESVAAAAQPFKSFAIEPGETRWECVERAARQRALLLMADGLGGLLITRASTLLYPVALVEGENILSATLRRDHSARFRRYIALGQGKSNEWDDTGAAHLKSSKVDTGIRSPRTLIFQAEDLADGISLDDRCTWERNVRRGRANSITIRVQGFGTARGGLWPPNVLVRCKLPSFDIEQTLLLVDVSHSIDESGSFSELTISPRTAYDLLPEKPSESSLEDWGDDA